MSTKSERLSKSLKAPGLDWSSRGFFFFTFHHSNQVHGLCLLSWNKFAWWYHVKELSCEWRAARNLTTDMRWTNKNIYNCNISARHRQWRHMGIAIVEFKLLKPKLPVYVDFHKMFRFRNVFTFSMLKKVAVAEILSCFLAHFCKSFTSCSSLYGRLFN